MSKKEYDLVPIENIFVAPDRQRQEFNEAKQLELDNSIRKHGLIHPIVISEDNTLIAGERRLRSYQRLDYSMIEVRYIYDLNEQERQLVEFEENIRRSDLTWQEHTQTIARFHELKKTVEEDWSQEKTGVELDLTAAAVSQHLLVSKAMEEGVEQVNEAPKFSSAYSFAQRRKERQQTANKADIKDTVESLFVDPTSPTEETTEEVEFIPVESEAAEIMNGDFIEWCKTPVKIPFNLIHCDFPYGINATKIGQSAAKSAGGYNDDEETYWKLLEAFVNNLDNFCAPSAHLVFWFSMNYYEQTKEILESAGFRVFLPLLIWGRSDNKGILADQNRVPRNITETALLCSRGDRKIVRATSNAVWATTTKEYHMSEKPYVVTTHFLRMLVDESTRLLDPTAGSGMAIKCARELGAEYSLGIELNPDYAADAQRNLES